MLVKEVVGVCDGLTGGSQDRMIRSEFVMLASVIFAQTHRINDLCCSVVYIGFINLAPFHEVIVIVCPIIIERRQKKSLWFIVATRRWYRHSTQKLVKKILFKRVEI